MERDDIQALYEQGPEAIAALIAHYDAELARLRAQVQALTDRLAKDSHNSHQPPSRDYRPKPTSLRTPSGRKPGGQAGHRGTTLAWCATPDRVVTQRPTICAGCGASLADAPVVRTERRQVMDLPVLRLATTEQVVETRGCPHCGCRTRGAFPPEARSRVSYGPQVLGLAVYLHQFQLLPYARIQDLLAELFGCSLSVGTIVAAVAAADAALAETEAAIQQAVQQAPVAHFDETSLRVDGHRQWIHVAGTAHLTHYGVQRQRGRAGMDAVGVLPAFTGVAVHDGLHAYETFKDARHARCNVHHLRELTFVAERVEQAWADGLKDLLWELHEAAATARAAGHDHLPASVVADAVRRYRQLAQAGLDANPPTPKASSTPGPRKRTPAGKLAERLGRHELEALAFLHDLRVPFDNNQAERDLRMVKVQQKIAGTFRSAAGAAQFARIRGYLSTARKQGHSPLAALQAACAGHPLVLA